MPPKKKPTKKVAKKVVKPTKKAPTGMKKGKKC
jgi:hypothetical protein